MVFHGAVKIKLTAVNYNNLEIALFEVLFLGSTVYSA